MQKPHNKIKAILSYFSFDLCILFMMSTAFAAGQTPQAIQVEVPVEVFQRKSKAQASLQANLWLAVQKNQHTSGRAILLINDWDNLAPFLSHSGFNVLSLTHRRAEKSRLKSLVEDIQSGIAFLKTDSRTEASRVVMISKDEATSGALHYAAANKQMAYILDGVTLVNPVLKPSPIENLQSITGVPVFLIAGNNDKLAMSVVSKSKALCKTTRCTAYIAKKGVRGTEIKNSILNFVMRPHG